MSTNRVNNSANRWYRLVLVTMLAFAALVQGSPDSTASPKVLFSPGDAVKIRIYPDSAGFPNGIYPIDQNGFIDLPIIGYFKIRGLSEETLADVVKQTYIDYLPHPNVMVRGQIRATLQGGFRQPGLFWVDPGTTLWQLIKNGGGTIRTDGLEKMRWMRDGQIVTPSLLEAYQSGTTLAEMGFRSGDQIAVTHYPQRTGWEIFRSEIMPTLTFFISIPTSALSTYLLYRNFNETRK